MTTPISQQGSIGIPPLADQSDPSIKDKTVFKNQLNNLILSRLPTVTTVSEAKAEVKPLAVNKTDIKQKIAEIFSKKNLERVGLGVGAGLSIIISISMLPLALPGAALGLVLGGLVDRFSPEQDFHRLYPKEEGIEEPSTPEIYAALGGIASLGPFALALLAIEKLQKDTAK